jgi:hypothetical protein
MTLTTLDYMTVSSGLLPIIHAKKGLKIFFAGALGVGITGLLMKYHDIDNGLLYGIYTVVEFIYFTYLFLGYARLNRLLAFIPVILGSLFFWNDELISTIELSVLLALSWYAKRRIASRAIDPYFDTKEYQIAGVAFIYSLSAFCYSHTGAGAEIYAVLNIITNYGFYKSLGA